MLEALSITTLDVVAIAPSTLSSPNNSTNDSEGLCFRQKEIDSNPTELVRDPDSLPNQACSYGKRVPEKQLVAKTSDQIKMIWNVSLKVVAC